MSNVLKRFCGSKHALKFCYVEHTSEVFSVSLKIVGRFFHLFFFYVPKYVRTRIAHGCETEPVFVFVRHLGEAYCQQWTTSSCYERDDNVRIFSLPMRPKHYFEKHKLMFSSTPEHLSNL